MPGTGPMETHIHWRGRSLWLYGNIELGEDRALIYDFEADWKAVRESPGAVKELRVALAGAGRLIEKLNDALSRLEKRHVRLQGRVRSLEKQLAAQDEENQVTPSSGPIFAEELPVELL
jgi:uncharacterized coiled-coil protein SlyX